MENDLGKDIVDGKIIDWGKLSIEELTKMKKAYEEKESRIMNIINNELNETR